ncbi:unnamed protein product [Lota lota]
MGQWAICSYFESYTPEGCASSKQGAERGTTRKNTAPAPVILGHAEARETISKNHGEIKGTSTLTQSPQER